MTVTLASPSGLLHSIAFHLGITKCFTEIIESMAPPKGRVIRPSSHELRGAQWCATEKAQSRVTPEDGMCSHAILS